MEELTPYRRSKLAAWGFQIDAVVPKLRLLCNKCFEAGLDVAVSSYNAAAQHWKDFHQVGAHLAALIGSGSSVRDVKHACAMRVYLVQAFCPSLLALAVSSLQAAKLQATEKFSARQHYYLLHQECFLQVVAAQCLMTTRLLFSMATRQALHAQSHPTYKSKLKARSFGPR